MRNGAQIAVEQINASGGVLGKKLVLVDRDDEAKKVAIPICPQIAMEAALQKETQEMTRHFRHLLKLSRDQIKQMQLCAQMTNQ
jgi:hypothetical protein